MNKAAFQNKLVTNGIERTCAVKLLLRFLCGTNYKTKYKTVLVPNAELRG